MEPLPLVPPTVTTGNAGTGFRYRTHLLVALAACVSVLVSDRRFALTALRPTLTGWLTRLATEYRGQPGPAGRGVELIVDHFDGENGRAFERLQGRIERGEFRDKHLVLLICNPDLPAFRALAKLALTRGGVQSVTIPRDPLQAAPSPLVVEVLRDRFRRSPVRNPAEAVAEATCDVRERLERCAEDPNPQQALRAEFGGTADDPVKLFQRNGAFDKDMLREMIKSLKLQEKSFIPLVKNDRTRGDESSG